MLNPLSALLASDYWKSRVLAPEIGGSDDLSKALRIIRSRWPKTFTDNSTTETPIFLFSAGWGSGSTLLQRLVISGNSTLLWGEPHDHAVPIHRLSQMLVPINDRWPKDFYFKPKSDQLALQDQWVANLSPHPASLQQAHIRFIETWLRDSAAAEGCSNWGLKEVRLTVDHARYLRWLFPHAKFLFLYRDVIASYRSCRAVPWFSVWPDYRVSRPSAFAHHWKHLLSGFVAGATELDALLVKYEDLVSGEMPLALISDYLDTGTLDDGILGNKLGSRSGKHGAVKRHERWIIRSITDELRQQLGYI
jgi:Sulfotransferase family